jgi:hypothetical protein
MEWAIEFSSMAFSNMLLATGDFKNFVYTSKDITFVNGNPAMFEIMQSSLSQSPVSIEVFNRVGY